MPTKANGDWIPGPPPVPSNHPDPASQNVNAHPMEWAYGKGNELLDRVAPSAPTNLASATHTATSVGLSWTASTDNIGVTGYNVYANGVKKGTTATLSTTVAGLTTSTPYLFTVKALDAKGNESAASNSVSVTPA